MALDLAKPSLIGTIQAALLICVATALAWLLTEHLMPLRVASNWLDDLRVAYFSPTTPQHPDIVVLTITEDTLAELPFRSPLDRNYLADQIDLLASKGAALVALDIIFDQPTTPAADNRLRATLKNFPGAVVVAGGDALTGLSERQLLAQEQLTDGIPRGLAVITKTDGVARFSYPGRATEAGYQASFVNVMATQLGQVPPDTPQRLRFLVAESGQSSAIRNFPLHFLARLPDDWFKDQLVLIGADLPNQDRHRTPLTLRDDSRRGTPGVLVHAQALAQIIDGQEYAAAGASLFTLCLALMATVGLLLSLLKLNVLLKIGASLLVVGAYLAAGAWAYTSNLLPIPLFAPCAAFLMGYAFTTAYSRRHERQAKRFLHGAFRRYVSSAVIDDLIANPERLDLGGESRDMSFVFSDIAGFTSLSESLAAQELVSLLQSYFNGMADIAMKYNGTIERFLGDSVLVFFGAPSAQADHAERAVRCAVEWDAYCEAFRQARQAEGIDFGVTRIGVHSGSAVVGNVGSRDRFEYTAHGDVVNTTARLETVNKHLGTRVCISAAAAARCEDIPLIPVGDLVLKGRSEPLSVLTLCGDLPQSGTDSYLHAFASMETKNSESVEHFLSLSDRYPDNGLIAFHLERLRSGQQGSTIRFEEK